MSLATVLALTHASDPASALAPTRVGPVPPGAGDPGLGAPGPGDPGPGDPGAGDDLTVNPPARVRASSTDGSAAQCQVSNGPLSTDAANAAAVMAGRVDLSPYGYYTLADDPDWQPQSTLDASGNANLHGLTWALPLLREGSRTSDTAMIERFAALLQDWRDDVPLAPLAATGPYSGLPEGQRLLTLTCAAAGPLGTRPWARDMLTEQAEWDARPDHWRPVNNVHLTQAMGLYAAGQALGRQDLADVAVRRIDQAARRLLDADGSDREGALPYALYDYNLLRIAEARLTAGGTPVPDSVAASRSVPPFLAQATRPDGLLELLGDGQVSTPRQVAGTPLEWPATRGASGTPPTRTLSRFTGGYVFGRSGWGTGDRAFGDETYFSQRTGGTGTNGAHSHDDVGSITLASWGSQLLFDSGPWRYENSARRAYVRSRAAHNVVDVPRIAHRRAPATLRAFNQTAAGSLITLTDDEYDGLTLTRTLWYDRDGDFLVVWDTLARRGGPLTPPATAYQRWQLGRDRTVSTSPEAASDPASAAVTTGGPGANLAIRWVGTAPALSVAKGRTTPTLLGWNSLRYADLAPAPTVSAALAARTTVAGTSWTTVLVPLPPGETGDRVTATGTTTGTEADLTVSAPTGRRHLRLSRTAATSNPLP